MVVAVLQVVAGNCGIVLQCTATSDLYLVRDVREEAPFLQKLGL